MVDKSDLHMVCLLFVLTYRYSTYNKENIITIALVHQSIKFCQDGNILLCQGTEQVLFVLRGCICKQRCNCECGQFQLLTYPQMFHSADCCFW